ncbi:Rv3235 family protein [Ornithinimicrobium sediminis]|uniref:Rv3235 family protein n=1 Tax=Ornithinimicrobium sediminis TaxID=2904603 RepID=UPI001E621BB5|nr:Rv3235 family protein [Ornithinimicrobium sediminis]MCE0486485.1 Rv3235 family protein [Ornithinimicrobium sediminis]
MSVLAPLRVLPVPRSAPPVVVLTPADWSTPVEEEYVQGTLAVDVHPLDHDPHFGPQATRAADLPDPAPWARQIIRVCLEVVDGVRPANQLTRRVSPELRESLARRGVLARRRRQRQRHAVRVRALLCSQPADGVAEISAVVTHSSRVRALALRMVGVDGRWVVTVFDLG